MLVRPQYDEVVRRTGQIACVRLRQTFYDRAKRQVLEDSELLTVAHTRFWEMFAFETIEDYLTSELHMAPERVQRVVQLIKGGDHEK